MWMCHHMVSHSLKHIVVDFWLCSDLLCSTQHFSCYFSFVIHDQSWLLQKFITLLQEILGDCGRAAIQTQGSTSNPFGSTFVYGYQNIAFEVDIFLGLIALPRNPFLWDIADEYIFCCCRSWRMVILRL